MPSLQNNLLTWIVFLPAAGALLTLAAQTGRQARWVALGTSVATLALALLILVPFQWRPPAGAAPSYACHGQAPFGVVQLVREAPLVPQLNVRYRVGVDGLSLPLVLLATFISVLSIVASWGVTRMTQRFLALLLFFEAGVLGTLLSLDFVLFYAFFELSLVPIYLLIRAWGGSRNGLAANKLLLHTLVGSVALLIVLIGTHQYARGGFDLIGLPGKVKGALASGAMPAHVGRWLFALAVAAFLIRVPSAPFHTWLPDAHADAPTPVGMLLSALLPAMGGYGIFRVAYPLFPDAARELWFPAAALGAGSITYAALGAIAQSDFKRLAAYGSVTQTGFILLGAAVLTRTAASGALFMIVAHGVVGAMTVFAVGVAHDRARHREMARLGGFATTMPLYTGLSSVAIFAGLGLPGLCAFVGVLMTLLGTFDAARADSVLTRAGATPLHLYAIATVACLGMVLAAAAMLRAIQRVYFGPERPEHKGFKDADPREQAVLWPLAVAAVLLGVFPTWLVFMFTDATVEAWIGLFVGK
jgi:NADH-quinone oxidoreductase subunit M